MRHGETEWSRTGQHTSSTELDLLPDGEAQALALRPVVEAIGFDLVLCSPRRRAQRTAELASLVPYTVTDDLREWDYGAFEGLTIAEIRQGRPEWTIWIGPWEGGETASDVTARADRVIDRILDSGADKVALVGHGHFSRVIAARWVGQDISIGQWLDLDTATLSELSWARGVRILRRWNSPATTEAWR